MTSSLDIPHWIERINQLNGWLCAFPMPQEYRERTTFREFHELVQAKQSELGLTPEVIAQLRDVVGNSDLDWAWQEVGMTEDNREMLCPTYFIDLPMNYYWMDEYEPVIKAVDDYMDSQPPGKNIPDEELLEVVQEHLPPPSQASS
ncbi:hypothetical protein [Stenotrophomonas pigmentata]|uniref:hypothetical protein n=1 Tax=Stenotrophomonas pigmentata TaxID=3055080 RepID=UPI0026F0A31C|nr:hypothetical protein [Stenotrophomonas sp. 610A2]